MLKKVSINGSRSPRFKTSRGNFSAWSVAQWQSSSDGDRLDIDKRFIHWKNLLIALTQDMLTISGKTDDSRKLVFPKCGKHQKKINDARRGVLEVIACLHIALE
jgi:hypothetical protein